MSNRISNDVSQFIVRSFFLGLLEMDRFNSKSCKMQLNSQQQWNDNVMGEKYRKKNLNLKN